MCRGPAARNRKPFLTHSANTSRGYVLNGGLNNSGATWRLSRAGPVRSAHRSGAVRGVDADVLRSEVAGPVASAGGACVQVKNDRNVFGEQAVSGGSVVVNLGGAAAEDGDVRPCDFVR